MKKVQAAIFGFLLLVVLVGIQTIDFSKTENAAGETAETLDPFQLPVAANSGEPDHGTPSTRLDNDPAQYPAGSRTLATSTSSTSGPAWAVLEEQMRRDSDGLTLKVHPEGHGSLHGQGRFTHMSAAVRDASGKLVIQCFEGYAGLDDSLSGRTQAPANLPETNDYEVSDF